MGLRRVFSRASWRRRLAALALLAAAAALFAARAPVHAASRRVYAATSAATLAHLLADFSVHLHASLTPGSWRVEEERGNYTEWSYRVSFECGPRCVGRAAVHAVAEAGGAPRHGQERAHRVRLHLTACARPPLLPWPTLCDELEVEWAVLAQAEGCVLEERARAWCGAVRVLSGACARDLLAARQHHLSALHAALPARRAA